MQRFYYTFLLFLSFIITSKAGDCTNGRYLRPVFSQVDITKNIKYARKQQSDGQYIDLKYDVYQPHGDTVSLRPVMLLIHGGAYLKLLDQNSPDIVLMCNYFAQRGYVTVSIDYRQEPNLLGLLSEETMVKAVSRALIDTKDAIDHLIDTYTNGNPYRIDTSKAIIGGVSAGAVSAMFISYLDSMQMLPQNYQNWIIQANGPNADSILRHKFDKVKPKITISISGGLLDTSWIKSNNIDVLLVHGSADEIVPYNFGHPFNIQTLPVLYGGKSQYPRMMNQGIRCEFEDWIGRGHVPFMNLSFPDIIFNLINQPILDSTERHIAAFCYRLMDCDTRTTGIKENIVASNISVFPNPSRGFFTIQLPKETTTNKWNVTIYDIAGKEIQTSEYPGNTIEISVNEKLPAGIYFIKMFYEKNGEIFAYTGKITISF